MLSPSLLLTGLMGDMADWIDVLREGEIGGCNDVRLECKWAVGGWRNPSLIFLSDGEGVDERDGKGESGGVPVRNGDARPTRIYEPRPTSRILGRGDGEGVCGRDAGGEVRSIPTRTVSTFRNARPFVVST